MSAELQSANSIRFSGQILEKEPLRYTPAGIPVAAFRIGHESKQWECELERFVRCEIGAQAIGPLAHQISAMAVASVVTVEGFLANRSARSKSLVLHVSKLELLEGLK